RHFHVAQRFANALDRDAERYAGLEVCVDVIDALAVHPVDVGRSAAHLLRDERRDRQDAVRRAHGDIVEVDDAQTVFGAQADVDIDFLAADAVHAGASSADARLDRRRDVLHAQAELGHALPVELNVLLRPAPAVARGRVADAGPRPGSGDGRLHPDPRPPAVVAAK